MWFDEESEENEVRHQEKRDDCSDEVKGRSELPGHKAAARTFVESI